MHRWKEPSALSLVLRTHLQPTRGAPGGREVKVQVLFESKAFYSSCIAVNQMGDEIASFTEVGGEGIEGREV